MSEELTKREPLALNWGDIKERFASNATEQEFAYFLDQINLFQLDPRKREIYFMKYKDHPGQTVIGYQEFLKRAEAASSLNGWRVSIGEDQFGRKATITIDRKDWAKSFTWDVYDCEFNKKQSTWNQMPLFMLRKVAIGQGFRLCFPNELGNLPYLREEIEFISDVPAAIPVSSQESPPGERKRPKTASSSSERPSGSQKEPTRWETFLDAHTTSQEERNHINGFVDAMAPLWRSTPGQVREKALLNPQGFLTRYEEWLRTTPEPPLIPGIVEKPPVSEIPVTEAEAWRDEEGTI